MWQEEFKCASPASHRPYYYNPDLRETRRAKQTLNLNYQRRSDLASQCQNSYLAQWN